VDERFLGILRSLLEHDVRFVVIGGAALPVHGHVRYTDDIDIFVDPADDNLPRLRAALTALRYPVWLVDDETLRTKKLLFRHIDPLLDVHPFVKGADWDGVYRRRVIEEFRGLRVPYVGLDDLIAMKRAAGRPEDVLDLRYLEEARRQLALRAGASAPETGRAPAPEGSPAAECPPSPPPASPPGRPPSPA
jgi:hypothetical protein